LLFFFISLLSGITGGMLVPLAFGKYTLGGVGNAIAGFLGGATAYLLILNIFDTNSYWITIPSGLLAGIIARVGFSIIRARMAK